MKKKKITQIFIIFSWLLAFSFLIFVDITYSDPPLFILILITGIIGFVFLMHDKQDGESNSNMVIVETKKSHDGIVVATIIEWTQERRRAIKNDIFTCGVKRNYKEGVFYKEKSFDDLSEARAWLKDIYFQELEKHLQKIEKPAS